MYAAEHAKSHPDQAAFVMATSGETLTFGEYEKRCNRLAHMYRDVGLRRGDHVAFFLENNLRIFECEGAAERTGLYFTAINSYLSAEETAYIVNDSSARVVVTSAAMFAVASGLPQLCPAVERWLVVDRADGPDASPWEGYESAVAGYPDTPVDDEELGAAMLYSSGTTGQPKGILRPLPETKPNESLPLVDGSEAVVAHGRRHGVPLPSAPVPLGAAGQRVDRRA